MRRDYATSCSWALMVSIVWSCIVPADIATRSLKGLWNAPDRSWAFRSSIVLACAGAAAFGTWSRSLSGLARLVLLTSLVGIWYAPEFHQAVFWRIPGKAAFTCFVSLGIAGLCLGSGRSWLARIVGACVISFLCAAYHMFGAEVLSAALEPGHTFWFDVAMLALLGTAVASPMAVPSGSRKRLGENDHLQVVDLREAEARVGGEGLAAARVRVAAADVPGDELGAAADHGHLDAFRGPVVRDPMLGVLEDAATDAGRLEVGSHGQHAQVRGVGALLEAHASHELGALAAEEDDAPWIGDDAGEHLGRRALPTQEIGFRRPAATARVAAVRGVHQGGEQIEVGREGRAECEIGEHSRDIQSGSADLNEECRMASPARSEIGIGMRVQIVEKHNQRSGTLTEGIVARILTSSATHPHGIKVMLETGEVGRVKAVVTRS
jgi:uncharacterized repeat protein (TIGR03833 family)